MVDRHSDIRLSAAAGTVVHIAVAQDTDQIGPKDQEGQLSFDIVRNTLSYYLVDIGSDVLSMKLCTAIQSREFWTSSSSKDEPTVLQLTGAMTLLNWW